MTNPATKAAEAMREAAASKAELLFDCISRGPGREEDIVARDTGNQIAAAIRALPLPEPPPDPRGQTIAWLRAELRAALTRCRYDGGYDRELGPIGCSLEATGQSCPCQVAAGIANESDAILIIAEKDVTIARLSADRDRIEVDHDSIADDRDGLRYDLVEAKRDRNRLSAELEAAREALAPFTKSAFLDQMESPGAQLLDWRLNLTVGDFRRARAVLAKLAKGE